ncbi:MAG: class I tRNA ligase family protein, partial [Halobacteriota archaeon]
EFEYWYPVDVRFSAGELISNHLTFYLYHHAELFDPPRWPKGITSMGMGLVRGQSMSSSAGRVVLADQTVQEHGADTVRFFLLNAAEPWQDFDWRPDPVANTRNQLERFWRRAQEVIDGPAGERDLRPIDRWLLGRLQTAIVDATSALEEYETRRASQLAFYELEDDLRWYRRRTDTDRPGARWTLREVLRVRLLLLAPFIPFMANELHERLTGEPAEQSPWPKPELDLIDERLEATEALLADLVDDIASILDVTGREPEVIRVYTAAAWKREVLDEVLEADQPDQGSIISRLMQRERFRSRGDAVPSVVAEVIDLVHERSSDTLGLIAEFDEAEAIEGASHFLAEEFDATIQVYREDEDPVDPADRAGNALPARPAIYVE